MKYMKRWMGIMMSVMLAAGSLQAPVHAAETGGTAAEAEIEINESAEPSDSEGPEADLTDGKTAGEAGDAEETVLEESGQEQEEEKAEETDAENDEAAEDILVQHEDANSLTPEQVRAFQDRINIWKHKNQLILVYNATEDVRLTYSVYSVDTEELLYKGELEWDKESGLYCEAVDFDAAAETDIENSDVRIVIENGLYQFEEIVSADAGDIAIGTDEMETEGQVSVKWSSDRKTDGFSVFMRGADDENTVSVYDASKEQIEQGISVDAVSVLAVAPYRYEEENGVKYFGEAAVYDAAESEADAEEVANEETGNEEIRNEEIRNEEIGNEATENVEIENEEIENGESGDGAVNDSIYLCSITIPQTSYVYTGWAIRPYVTVKYGTITLTQGIDYTVEYYYNTNAGTAIIVIHGMGGYSGTAYKTFTITKAAPTLYFASNYVSKKLSDGAFTNTLTKTTDGTVTFSSGNSSVATVNSSTGQVTIKGVGTATITASASEGNNYKAGTASYSLTVQGNSISNCTITIPEGSCTYTGQEIKPPVTVKNGTTTLTEGSEYTVAYSGNINAGTATITVTGKGTYTGTAYKYFTISKSAPVLFFANTSITRRLTDSSFTNVLTMITDGTARFTSSNTSVATVDSSTGQVTIKGAGSVTITLSVSEGNNYKSGTSSYTILVPAEAINISDCTISIPAESYVYTGREIRPAVTIRNGTTTLNEGMDYTTAYSGNTNAGTATITMTGIGAYTGTAKKTFKITKAAPSLSFASASVSKKTTDSAFTNKLTKKTDGTVTFKSSNTAVATVNKSTGQVTLKGAGKTRITASAAAGTNYSSGSASYLLTVTAPLKTYTVTYNANGGTGAPAAQKKTQGVTLKLSTAKPAKKYVIKYDARGGSVSSASKSVSCTFKNWNTTKDGKGKAYAPGANYTANAAATLYAQWTNPKAGTLATPKRSGQQFNGWYTAASGGTKIGSTTTITKSMTLYAHWSDPYNLKDETYSFPNYGDYDSFGGHCFGMSITSAGYYNKLLDIGRIGGNANSMLYNFRDTWTVRQPICHYQAIQGSHSLGATVAGGSFYKTGHSNISSDWKAVVNYVKGHSYDGKGLLQIGFRKTSQGGHAINFLRYENVNGQDRIYAYDNNFPTTETYFYKDSYGRVWQKPVQTFSGSIDCIALRDVRKYFRTVGSFDPTHALYMPKDEADVLGYDYTYMDGDYPEMDYVMYEIPADQDRVTIIPRKDNAVFTYMGTEFNFGEITEQTCGELRLTPSDELNSGSDFRFIIYEDDQITPDVTLSETSYIYNGSVQKPEVTVKVDGDLLTEEQDYTVEYPSGMIDTGIYKIKIVLKGDYEGSAEKSFAIVPGKTSRGDMFNLANNVKVTWKEVPGAKYYKVYREGITDPEETRRDPVIVTTGLVGWDNEDGLVNGHAYRYKIVASVTGEYDPSGDSTLSYSKLMYRLKTVVIRSVKNTGAGEVTVRYDKTDSGDSYVLQYSEDRDMTGAKTKVVQGADHTSYVISGLKKGATYYISIRVRKKVDGIDYYTTFGVPKEVTVTQ